MSIEYEDVPPVGWFVISVARCGTRGWDWGALMTDVHPDELKNCTCESPLWLYVHPKEYRPGPRKAHARYVRIPGKYKSRDAAWNALEEMMTTRH